MNERNKSSAITDFQKNTENPFLKQAIQQVEKSIVKKYKTSGTTDKKAILQAFDPDSGEVLGHTQFIKQIEVDESQFAKLYLSNFSAFFDLNNQAIRVFGYIMTVLIPNKDWFLFDLDECLDYTKYKSETSIRQGLTFLLKAEIIARGKSDNIYFINPMVFFNGNRISFTKTYVKKQKTKSIAGPELPFPDQID